MLSSMMESARRIPAFVGDQQATPGVLADVLFHRDAVGPRRRQRVVVCVGVGESLGVGSVLWAGEPLGAGSELWTGESLGSTGADVFAAGATGASGVA